MKFSNEDFYPKVIDAIAESLIARLAGKSKNIVKEKIN